ncbi:MAG: patatin-like phospholipase family protein [Leptospirales bacterium]|nr:patatin-like phospholipase family protein [Leptospirales bacterium]
MTGQRRKPAQESFGLVLSGGGARGLAHIGVLKAFEDMGMVPSLIVGVSMGALVGIVFGLRPDWYALLSSLDFSAELGGGQTSLSSGSGLMGRIGFWISAPRRFLNFFSGWGLSGLEQSRALSFLTDLTQGKQLESSRVKITTAATDLLTGRRIVFRKGDAARAIYASAALAGIFQPLNENGLCLADGAYTDLAPIDLARRGNIPVIAVDVTQMESVESVTNGFQAITRAMDICHNQHAHLRFAEADLVLRPRFTRIIDTLDFTSTSECVRAGYAIVKENKVAIASVLRLRGKNKKSVRRY